MVLSELIHVCAVQSDQLGLPGSDSLAHLSGGVCWLLAGPLPPHASHPPRGCPELLYLTVNCPQGAAPGLGSHTTSLLQDPASQPATGQPQFKGWGEQQSQTVLVAQGGSWGAMDIIIHSRVERPIINARVRTLSVSPLNSKALEELKILFTFVPPVATPTVLWAQWVFHKFAWIN